MNYYDKSIEELTGISLGEPKFDSYVVRTTYRVARKPISELTAEEIRMLIVQRHGVKFVLHRAVLIVEKDPLIECAHFEGDLMKALLELEKEDWSENKADYALFKSIVAHHKDEFSDTLIPKALLEKHLS